MDSIPVEMDINDLTSGPDSANAYIAKQMEKLNRIDETEQLYRIETYKYLSDVLRKKIHCTLCHLHLEFNHGQSFTHLQHPLLKVLCCYQCVLHYRKRIFTLSPDMRDQFCRWCSNDESEESPLRYCRLCPFAFCERCIENNMSIDQHALANKKDWLCIVCNMNELWPLRGVFSATVAYSKYIQTRPQNWQTKGDLSQCCLRGNRSPTINVPSRDELRSLPPTSWPRRSKQIILSRWNETSTYANTTDVPCTSRLMLVEEKLAHRHLAGSKTALNQSNRIMEYVEKRDSSSKSYAEYLNELMKKDSTGESRNYIVEDPLAIENDSIEFENDHPEYSVYDCIAMQKLILSNVSKQEQKYRKRNCESLKAVLRNRIHCTICDVHIGYRYGVQFNKLKHPLLKVLCCRQCTLMYKSARFQLSPTMRDQYCRWCTSADREESPLRFCSSCPFAFCEACIYYNIHQRTKKNWLCLVCNIKQLWPLRRIFSALVTHSQSNQSRKKPGHSKKDLSLCCLSQAIKDESRPHPLNHLLTPSEQKILIGSNKTTTSCLSRAIKDESRPHPINHLPTSSEQKILIGSNKTTTSCLSQAIKDESRPHPLNHLLTPSEQKILIGSNKTTTSCLSQAIKDESRPHPINHLPTPSEQKILIGSNKTTTSCLSQAIKDESRPHPLNHLLTPSEQKILIGSNKTTTSNAIDPAIEQ